MRYLEVAFALLVGFIPSILERVNQIRVRRRRIGVLSGRCRLSWVNLVSVGEISRGWVPVCVIDRVAVFCIKGFHFYVRLSFHLRFPFRRVRRVCVAFIIDCDVSALTLAALVIGDLWLSEQPMISGVERERVSSSMNDGSGAGSAHSSSLES